MTGQILFFDGFENYQDAFVHDQNDTTFMNNMIDAGYASVSSLRYQGVDDGYGWSGMTGVNPRTGRGFAAAHDVFGSFRKSCGSDLKTVGVAIAVYLPSLPSSSPGAWRLIQFRNSDNHVIASVGVGTTGRIRIWKGVDNAVAAESTKEIPAGAWKHVEAICTVSSDGTTFDMTVYVDEVNFTSVTGYASEWSGTDIAQVAVGQASNGNTPEISGWGVDDFVIHTYSTPIGMNGAYYLRPVADTYDADFSLSTGSDGYALIDERKPDDDSEFIYADTTSKKSRFDVEALPNNIVSVAAVQPMGRVRKTDAGACGIKVGIKSGTTEDQASEFTASQSYQYATAVWEVDPDTSSAFDPSSMPSISIERTT